MEFVAGGRDLRVGHHDFLGPSEDLDVVHADGAVVPAVARAEHEAQIDLGGTGRNHRRQLDEALPPGGRVRHGPRRPSRIRGEGPLLARQRPEHTDVGEAVGPAQFGPRHRDVLGGHQRQLELDPRHIGGAEAPGADVAHVERAAVDLAIPVEHVVDTCSGIRRAHQFQFVGWRPGDGRIGQQAARPRLGAGFHGRVVGEAPRGEHHLAFAHLWIEPGVVAFTPTLIAVLVPTTGGSVSSSYTWKTMKPPRPTMRSYAPAVAMKLRERRHAEMVAIPRSGNPTGWC
jgi:hypothetical protein